MIEVIAKAKEWEDKAAALEFRLNNNKSELMLIEAQHYLTVCNKTHDGTDKSEPLYYTQQMRESATRIACESDEAWVVRYAQFTLNTRDLAKARSAVTYYSRLVAYAQELLKTQAITGILTYFDEQGWDRFEEK